MTSTHRSGSGPVADERTPLAPGDRLGRWEILEVLGRGGMGVVYRAESDGRTVALKAIHPHLLERREFLRRFHLEAEAGARIRHPNVVRTYGVETVDGPNGPVHVLLMEYVRGRTLAELQVEHGRVPEGLLRDVAIQVASGLAAIHEAGVIHRDLKPENVLLTDAHEVKVMDLGVARLRHEEVRLSRTGQFVGSLLFAAPEQMGERTSTVGPAADLYSFGLLLFHLAAGRHPFECETVGEIVSAHLHEAAPPLRSLVPEASPFLTAVVATLLEKDPAARFPSARALKETLEAGEASPWWRERRGGAEAPRPRREGDPGTPPLLGRSRELRELADAWTRARRGAGSAILLVGEEGVGKSRVLSAFLESADLASGDALLVGGGRADDDPTCTGFRHALAAALPRGAALEAEAARLLPGQGARTATLASLLRDPAARPAADGLADAGLLLADLVLAMAHERPRVVAIDDLHLAGEADRAVFRALAAAAPDHALLLVATATAPLDPRWRDELLEAPGLREWVLPRLDAEAMRGVLRALVGARETGDALAPDLIARAGGTPQVLERLVEGLKASGSLRRGAGGVWRLADDRAPSDLPTDVRDLVLRRLAIVLPSAREVLEGACVQGRSFDVRVVAAVLERPVLAVLEDLVGLTREPRLVRGEGRLRRFDPAVVQEVVWGGLDPARRAALHRRTAGAFAALGATGEMDRERGLPRVALHHLLGGDAPRAAPVLLAALDGLLEERRNEEAMELTRLAIAAGPEIDAHVRAETLLRRARLLELQGRRDEERACLEETLAAATAARRPASMALLDAYGRCLLALGERRRAEETFGEQLAAAEATGDAPAQAAALGVLARLAAGGDVATARARAERALRLARATAQPGLEAAALGLLAAAFERDGRPDLAADHQARRLALATRTGDAREAADAHGGLARLALRRGRWREAQVHLDRQGSTAREIGHRRGEARARIGFGLLASARGRLLEARTAFEEAWHLARTANAAAEEAEADVHIARAALALGDAAGALPRLLRGLGIASRLDDGDTASLACLVAGAVAEDRGDGEEAAAWYRDAAARGAGAAGGWAEVGALLGLARAARLMGRPDRMAEPLDRAAALAARRRWPGPLVVAAALRATLPGGDPARAVGLLAEHGEQLAWSERLEVHAALHHATDDPWHLDEARAVLAGARGAAPAAESRPSRSGVAAVGGLR